MYTGWWFLSEFLICCVWYDGASVCFCLCLWLCFARLHYERYDWEQMMILTKKKPEFQLWVECNWAVLFKNKAPVSRSPLPLQNWFQRVQFPWSIFPSSPQLHHSHVSFLADRKYHKPQKSCLLELSTERCCHLSTYINSRYLLPALFHLFSLLKLGLWCTSKGVFLQK